MVESMEIGWSMAGMSATFPESRTAVDEDIMHAANRLQRAAPVIGNPRISIAKSAPPIGAWKIPAIPAAAPMAVR
jgi:hypothetical protein